MPRLVLIVDDNYINRQVLGNLVRKEYDVLEAQGGEEALILLRQKHEAISAVLLDIMMPGIDGYELLRLIRFDDDLAQIPVIMVTGSEDEESRVKAISLGANDFILKPYNPEIILHCLKNNIALRETVRTVNILQRDYLTGLYNREAFLEKVRDMVSAHEAGYYIMACFDIERFKVVNDQYGTEKGDEVLRYIAGVFKAGFNANGGIVCRVSADDFAVLYPASFADSDKMKEIHRSTSTVPGLMSPVVFCVGRYIVDDLTMSPSAMYDRAMMAAESVKGKYNEHIAFYDETLRMRLLNEQSIVNEMKSAIDKRQFEVWYQPQYNHSTGALIGAEALVRWRHPDKGLISPGVFIPIFEKNGFIYELDKYVWEEVCRFMRREIDDGRPPLPISVNISRYDLFCSDVVDVITGLVKKYELPNDLLRLEITESAFAKSTKEIVSVVKRLIACGFTLEIDDFGSGYSSLNTLKSVPAHIVKLDMRFFEEDDGTGRSGNIIESVVRMAKWLDMAVIAEGVENREQADYLKSIGCYYIQGYFYAHPMPVNDYVSLHNKIKSEPELVRLRTLETLDNNEFWNPKSMETLIFNSYIGGACIFEYYYGAIEVIRVNDQYSREFGSINPHGLSLTDARLSELLAEDERNKLESAIVLANKSMKEASCELKLCDGENTEYLYVTIRVIARVGERLLCYCVLQNITSQREAEIKEQNAARQLAAIIENIEGGVTASVFHDANYIEFIYANDGFYGLYGYSAEQWNSEVTNIIDLILPEDRDETIATVERIFNERGHATYEYRCRKRDGSIMWTRTTNTVISLDGVGDSVLLAVSIDITTQKQAEQKQTELLDSLPCGAGIYEFKNGVMSLIYQNKRYWELVGLYKADFPDNSQMSAIHPDDVPVVMRELSLALRENRDVSCNIRLRHLTLGYRPVHLTGEIVRASEDELLIYATFTPDVHDGSDMESRRLSDQLQAILDNAGQGILVAADKDGKMRYLFANNKYYEMLGYTRGQYESEVGAHSLETVCPEDRQRVFIDAKKFLDNGLPIAIEYRALRRDGSMPWFRLSVTSANITGIAQSVMLIFINDITREKQIEIDLLKASKAVGTLINDLPVGFMRMRVSTDGKFTVDCFNDKMCETLKMSRDELMKLYADDFINRVHKDDIQAMNEAVKGMADADEAREYRCRFRGGEGGYVWLSVTGRADKDNRGERILNLYCVNAN